MMGAVPVRNALRHSNFWDPAVSRVLTGWLNLAVPLALLLAAASAVPLAAQHWPSFRGPHASGVLDGAHPPLTWNVETKQHVRWQTAIPGLSHSSPVVWGDRVFVTSAISSSAGEALLQRGFSSSGQPAPDQVLHTWSVFALDRSTGRVVWERTAHRGVPRTLRHMKSSHASATPATDGRTVVAFFGSEGLFAFDAADGRMRWREDLGILDAGSIYYPERQWGVASSPVIDETRVIVQCDLQSGSFVAAFDLATGRLLWRTPREEIPSWASPSVYVDGDRHILVTNAGRFVRGYDARTGKELWRLANTSEIAVPTPIAADGLVVAMSGYQPAKPIYVIRTAASGDISLREGETTSSHVAWSRPRGGSYIPTPLAYRGLLYVLSTNGVLTCYDLQTGRQWYERRLGDRGGAYSASPVASDGHLFIAGEDGEIFVVKAGPEYALVAANAVGQTLMATPALADGMLIVRGLTHVFAFGAPR
jgi:outer membrane protein assembly factor BamB